MNAFDFARVLGDLFYCDDAEELGRKWQELDEDMRKVFFAQLCKDGFGNFLRWRFKGCNVLNAEETERLRNEALGYLQRATLDEMAFNELFGILETAHIRFCPIKGIDLAYRIYPSPSLRPFGDWDILFHPDDIGRVLGCLEKHGWKELLHKDGKGGHHSSPLVKGRYFMEPHWTLSCFTNADPRKIWDYLTPVEGNTCKHTLCPELNLLLIARHASEWNRR
ncbi:MAG: nucleotidyltransferase family protein, partial [Lentisphaeria bacterium]|nr:nucleotidyltransferase family protein [Lentisphaeria bacterium]